MKLKFFSLFITVFTIMVFSFSCSKDENNAATTPFEVRIHDTLFHSSAIHAKAMYNAFSKSIEIKGQNANQTQTLIIEMSPLAKHSGTWDVGTYDFDVKHVNNEEYVLKAKFVLYEDNAYQTWVSNWTYVKTGSVAIKYFSSSRIRGSFSFDLVKQNTDNTFNANNIIKFTAGNFDMPF